MKALFKLIIFVVGISILINLPVIFSPITIAILKSRINNTAECFKAFTSINISATELTQVADDWKISHGKKSLRRDENLCKVAEIRLEEIKTDWSHNKFPLKADDFEAEFNAKEVGENLATGFGSGDEKRIFESWLNSPSHRGNLEKNYSHMCIVCNENSCVQMFSTYAWENN